MPIDLALLAGLRSVDGGEASKLLGRSSPLPCGGLAIPYDDADHLGTYWRVRLDEPDLVGGARWLAPAGRPVPVYIPPMARAAVMDVTKTLYVVESSIKALSLTAAGYAAVGLGGTATTLTKDD